MATKRKAVKKPARKHLAKGKKMSRVKPLTTSPTSNFLKVEGTNYLKSDINSIKF